MMHVLPHVTDNFVSLSFDVAYGSYVNDKATIGRNKIVTVHHISYLVHDDIDSYVSQIIWTYYDVGIDQFFMCYVHPDLGKYRHYEFLLVNCETLDKVDCECPLKWHWGL